ncbi:hypothetical protein E5Q_00008 [Mixia osmundae IAM 14324]|uniref:Cysteine-rich transmembrane CYSTM domain-containing protein n=1 Tax=Mixia osmundae (strain CBS 9802 / IAM 14324 / JCM 22182 / KY 12970) TaxID=764103 RepID=G7DS08_MIXOS|nr:hypothetical protein E5Q_00008 [Mixia osmundae IAM 14324]
MTVTQAPAQSSTMSMNAPVEVGAMSKAPATPEQPQTIAEAIRGGGHYLLDCIGGLCICCALEDICCCCAIDECCHLVAPCCEYED